MFEIEEIKICVKALEKENKQNSHIWKTFVTQLIEFYELEDEKQKSDFWKKRLEQC